MVLRDLRHHGWIRVKECPQEEQHCTADQGHQKANVEKVLGHKGSPAKRKQKRECDLAGCGLAHLCPAHECAVCGGAILGKGDQNDLADYNRDR